MSNVLQNPENDLLKQLLPFHGDLQEILTTCQANLAVQVNYFGCGGMAISFCFRHLVGDAATAAYFLKNWAEVSRGGGNDIKDVIVDYTSIVRPYESIAVVKSVYEQQVHVSFPSERVVKRFTFDGCKIAALREKIGNGPYLDLPTHFEAISTLILGSLISIATDRERDEFTASKLAAVTAINLRSKTIPPLPPHSVGNFMMPAIANLPLDQKLDYNNIAGKIRESIRKVDHQYKRNVHGAVVVEGFSKSKVFSFSDWSTFPYYETDFGWEKPMWVTTVARMDTGTAFLSTSDGEGVEAWVALPKGEMAKFEQDPEILAYASFN